MYAKNAPQIVWHAKIRLLHVQLVMKTVILGICMMENVYLNVLLELI
jgi:hypothetical protein